MKQYEIRNLDLSEVINANQKSIELLYKSTKGDWLLEGFPNSEIAVLCEFETEAEADKRRLDWLENHYDRLAKHLDDDEEKKRFPCLREFIDSRRNAPRPTLTILAAPDGWTMDQIAPEIRERFEVKDGRKK